MITQALGIAHAGTRHAWVRSVLFLGVVLLSCLNGFSRCYYIRPSGNDLGNGLSPGSAWKTITKLNSINLAPGDSVLFEGGYVYTGSISINSGDGNDASNPVLISSYGFPATIDAGTGRGIYIYNSQGFVFKHLIVKGSGINSNTEDGISFYTDLTGVSRPKNIVVRDVEIFGFGKTGLTVGAWNGNAGFDDVIIDDVRVHDVRANGITSYGYTSPTHTGWAHRNVKITNSEIHHVPGYADPNNHKGSGIILGQVDGAVIEKCVAHHNGTANIACGGPGGIWAYDCNNVTIQFCESYSNSAGTGCDGLGFDLDGGVTNSVIQYCYSHDNDGAGFLLGQYANARIWKNNVVRFNISVNDGRTNSGGITLFKGPGTVMHSVDIYHNTIYIGKSAPNNNAGAFTIIDWNTGIDSVRVINNVFQSGGGEALVRIAPGYSAQMTGNLYYSGSGNFEIYDQNNLYTSLSSWRAATGREQHNNVNTGISANPLLISSGTAPVMWPASTHSLSAYKPATGSPVIEAGMSLSPFGINAGTKDYYVSAFPSGSKPDIGASEFQQAVPAPMEPVVTSTPGTTYSTSPSDPVVTGIQSQSGNRDIVAYPNPVSRGADLRVGGVSVDDEIEVFDLAGVKQVALRGDSIVPTANLPAGLYLLSVRRTNGWTASRKFFVR